MIVADTHILIWDALVPDRLSTAARQAIAQANDGDGLLICDISLWEIAMLIRKGRVQVDTDCHSFVNLVLQANKTFVQPITPRIAALSAELSAAVGKDPADRLIAATAIVMHLTLVTADSNLRSAPEVATLW